MKSINLLLGAATITLLGGWTQSANAESTATAPEQPAQQISLDQQGNTAKQAQVDKSALDLDVKGASGFLKQSGYYSQASFENLRNKAEEGNAALRSEAVPQQYVDEDANNILKAVKGLSPSPTPGPVDKSTLQTYEYGAEGFLDQSGYYSQASLENLRNKTEEANATLRSDAASQQVVNSQANNILNAVKQLQPKG